MQERQSWAWTEERQFAFNKGKESVCAISILVHFDPSMPLVVSCDTSPCGVGAVLSHVLENKSERPVCFASRSLTRAERNYLQLDREGLALIFAVKKFHNYFFCRQFIITTDHKPLLGLRGRQTDFYSRFRTDSAAGILSFRI